MKIKRKIIFSVLLTALLFFNSFQSVYSQGAGGPLALPNAFAGGPPPPPGGGGGGGPITGVPLDSDILVLLAIAGVFYFVYHNRNKWLDKKDILNN
jgi:hypothetical protein